MVIFYGGYRSLIHTFTFFSPFPNNIKPWKTQVCYFLEKQSKCPARGNFSLSFMLIFSPLGSLFFIPSFYNVSVHILGTVFFCWSILFFHSSSWIMGISLLCLLLSLVIFLYLNIKVQNICTLVNLLYVYIWLLQLKKTDFFQNQKERKREVYVRDYDCCFIIAIFLNLELVNYFLI